MDRVQRDGQYPYTRRDNTYEMSVVEGSTTNLTASAGGAETGDVGDFYAEISSLQDRLKIFNSNVARIDDLHSRLLNNADDAVSQRSAALLAELVEETGALSVLSTTLKRRIQTLERQQPSYERDAQVRIQQTALIKFKFLDTVQSYQQVEQRYLQKYKLRMERQFMIVKPDATLEEIRVMVNGESGYQAFSQALMDLHSHVDSRAAYREIQARHQNIQQIEQTIAELAQLSNDMKSEVIMIDNIETTAATVRVEKDLEAELALANNTIVSARATKKRLWICIFIILIILIIVIIIIVVSVVVASHSS